MRLSIASQVDSGNLNPDKAPDLYQKVDDIARQINAGDIEEAHKKVEALRTKLHDLNQGGQLSDAGYDVLLSDLEDISASLP